MHYCDSTQVSSANDQCRRPMGYQTGNRPTEDHAHLQGQVVQKPRPLTVLRNLAGVIPCRSRIEEWKLFRQGSSPRASRFVHYHAQGWAMDQYRRTKPLQNVVLWGPQDSSCRSNYLEVSANTKDAVPINCHSNFCSECQTFHSCRIR